MDLYQEPIKILDKLNKDGKSDMSNWQVAYLCGLIKERRPKKILEIGVSAGGTTAVILNCLSLLGIDAEMFSLDISDRYVINPKYEIGFMAKEAKKIISNCPKHQIKVGITPDLIDSVGGEIDFLILDTVHLVPGEILDFLVCLPYLSENATVVLHDVILHKFGCGTEIATQLLLDAVTAIKEPVFDVDNELGYPNIASFRINKDTIKYIYDVFSVLLLPWQYNVSETDILKYEKKYEELGYSKDCLKVFGYAAKKTNKTIEEHLSDRTSKIKELFELLNRIEGKQIYIYGKGKMAQRVSTLIENFRGFIITDGFEKTENDIYISDYISTEEDVILICVRPDRQNEIEGILIEKGLNNYLTVSQNVYSLFMEM